MPLPPRQLQAQLRGLLSFPVTPFTPDDTIDLRRYREHLRYMVEGRPDALFVCGGTGEFFSLRPDEYQALVRTAVEEVRGDVPVVAATGYGTKLAVEYAQVAEREGADGLLVLPPYLLQAEQEGLYEHYRAVAAATSRGTIIYQRDNAIFAPATVRRLAELPTVIGFKDGHGDMERLIRISLAVGDRLVMINGMPTAEMSARAFFGAGVTAYSSAVFNFVPEIARAFHTAISQGDQVRVESLLEGFYRPFVDLRDRVKGYAVALIKAGLKIQGRPVGPARSPLLNPTAEHEAELRAIIMRGLAL
ncbi:MAG TPA: 5-dehydro-4-deoxyglucarate dehydratase [Chloroflexota bacterium]|nr:5-dehydro-4-deoxyglucarate dehydratase [Chloroflexota bacterium]